MRTLNTFFSSALLATISLIGMDGPAGTPPAHHHIDENDSFLMVYSQDLICPLENEMLYQGSLGNTEKVRDLLNQGANPNAYDNNNMTIMHYAAEYGYIDIVNMLLTPPSRVTIDNLIDGEESPLFIAIKNNKITIIEIFLGKCTMKNMRPLCFAVEKGSLDTVQTLLKYIKANNADAQGCYPLCYAAQKGDVALIKLLIDKGDAQVNHCSQDKKSPLHRAAGMGHTGAAQLLIERGALVNVQEDEFNATPLHFAALNGHMQIVKILLLNDANVNEKNYCNKTALHYAALNNHLSVAQELLKHDGINIDIQDDDGKKALDLTKDNEIKQVLIDHENDKQRELGNEAQEEKKCFSPACESDEVYDYGFDSEDWFECSIQ